MLAHVEYTEGEPETYVLPLAVATAARADAAARRPPQLRRGVDRVALGRRPAVPPRRRGRPDASWRARSTPSAGAALPVARQGRARAPRPPRGSARRLDGAKADELGVQPRSGPSREHSVVFGDRIVMKMFRRVQEGVNPDLEIGRFLTEGGVPHTAPLLGALEYCRGAHRAPHHRRGLRLRAQRGRRLALHARRSSSIYYESAAAHDPRRAHRAAGLAERPARPTRPIPAEVADAIGPFLDSAELLGRRTAELHLALAAGADERLRARAVHHALPALGVPVDALAGPAHALAWCAASLGKLDGDSRRAGRGAARARGRDPRPLLRGALATAST